MASKDAAGPFSVKKNKLGRTELHTAVFTGDDERVKELLGSRADVDATDNGGQTALHMAAQREGETQILQMLLEANASTDVKDSRGFTPLEVANFFKCPETLKVLQMVATTGPECEGSDRKHVMLSGRFDKPEIIKYIKDVKRGLDEKGVKTYMVDCKEGDDFSEATMEGLGGAWAMIVFGTSEYGAWTGAGYETYEELKFAHQKKLPLFPIQLCERWPPEPRDKDGGRRGKNQNLFVLRDTVIRLSDPEMKKPQEIAEKLAERLLGTKEGSGHAGLKADETSQEGSGHTSLKADEKSQEGSGHASLKADEKSQEGSGHASLKADEKSQADQNAKDEEAAKKYEDSDDDPAICQAAEAGDIAAVRHLIRVDSGAVRRTHENGWTAMHCAAAKGHAEVLSALAKAGGDVEAEGGGRLRPLHRAASDGHAAAAAELLELGAAVAPKDCNGDTPLHKSAFYGRVEVAKLLLAARAPLDTKNGNGKTPLDLAKQYRKTDVVKLLEGAQG